MLCSVVKHLGSGDSTQEVGRNTQLPLVFPLALQQNRAQPRLLYLLTREVLYKNYRFNKKIKHFTSLCFTSPVQFNSV